MACATEYCSFVGLCYSEGSEICGPEIDFANCWRCNGGTLEYSPYVISPNYPERL